MLLLDACYVIAFILVSPLILVMLLVRPSFRAGAVDRFWPSLHSAPSRQTVWLHGSSAGEIDLLRALVERIASMPDDYRIVISVFSVSGHTAARKAFPEHPVIYFPVDFSPVVRRFLRTIEPRLIVLVESELWPNFLATVERAGIPVCLLNARMSDKSFQSHRRLPLIPWGLRKLSMLAAQSEEDATRFRDLGFPGDRLHVTGNMKYDLCDIGVAGEAPELRRQLRERYGIEPSTAVLIGGSVHRGEDKVLAQAYRRLIDTGRKLFLVIVPRYTADAQAMISELEQLKLTGVRRSGLEEGQSRIFDDPSSVLIVDTMGELKQFYAMSDIAYVGGSHHYRGSNKGGHNLMEPAVLGLAVLFGPHNYSFREIVRDLLEAEAGSLVHDVHELQASLEILLDDPQARIDMGQRARKVVLNNRGATRQNLILLRNYLSPGGTSSETHPNEGIHIQS